MILVCAILGAFYLTLAGLSIFIVIRGWSTTALVVFVPALVLMIVLIHLALADTLVLAAARARRIDRSAEPDLHAVIERLASLAGIPPPRLALSPFAAPNALAAGTVFGRATVAVTNGLQRRLTPPELEAVVAHEVCHIANRDTVVLTVASFFRTLAGVLDARRLLGADEQLIEDDWTLLGAWILHVVLTPIRWALLALGTVLTRALSRYREYAADRGAAVLTGAPEQLMSALQKLEGDDARIPETDLRRLATADAFLIVSTKLRKHELMMDHPPLEKRLARLATIARDMGKPVR